MLNVPDKITVVPSTHTSPKRQLRPATLHYWPAGLHTILWYCSLPARVPLQKLLQKLGLYRQGAYTYDPIISFPLPLYLPEYPCKTWGSRQGAYTYDPIISFPIPLYLPECPCTKLGLQAGGLYVRSYHLLSYSSSPARVPLQKLGL